MKPSVVLCLLLTGGVCVVGCRKRPAPGTEKTAGPGAAVRPGASKPTAPPARDKRYTWLVLNRGSRDHVIHLDVNGKRYTSFEDKASGFATKPSPLKEGVNSMLVTFLPRKGEEALFGSRLEILLSPTMLPPKEPLPGFECEIDEGYCEYSIEIEMANSVPGLLRYTRRDWLDEDRKRLVYEERVETGVFSEVFENIRIKTWTADGRLMREAHTYKEKLVAAKDYKPDGGLGAEVKDGTGLRREWYEDGSLASETPIAGGQANGVTKEYDGAGPISRAVSYHQGRFQGRGEARDLDPVR
ncbi:MAG: toxin-antitoxin system YwqK family antitoxin [Planctomycetota bacterium]|jgi:hypothetical protein